MRRPVPELAVAIEHVVDEGAMPILREEPGPLDERRMTEADKRLPRLEVPRLLLHIEALDAQATVLDERVASTKVPHTIPFLMTLAETFDVGVDTRTPVDDNDYQVPFRFKAGLPR